MAATRKRSWNFSQTRMKMLIQKLKASRPFALIGGINIIETYDIARLCAKTLAQACAELKIEFVFKASFDKANRSNQGAFRGPGLEKGLEQLARLKSDLPNLRVCVDVHEPLQCSAVKQAGLDMVQIPAFLCRQTDLIYAASDTGLPLLIKKGQFASAEVLKASIAKAASRPNYAGSILCERGTSVGPDNLMVDFRNLTWMRGTDALVALDATHAAQRPAARVSENKGSDGDLFAVESFARAGVAIGIDCLFMEVHPNPQKAPVDAKVQWPLDDFPRFLRELVDIGRASQWRNQSQSS